MRKKNKIQVMVMAAISGIIILLLDRATKVWALSCCSAPWHLTSWLSIEVALNRGIAWSIGAAVSPLALLIITTLITLSTMVAGVYWWAHSDRRMASFFVFMWVMAGAIGNVTDRWLYGGVIDFIVVHYQDWYFPTFNIADIAICCGALWWFIQELSGRGCDDE